MSRQATTLLVACGALLAATAGASTIRTAADARAHLVAKVVERAASRVAAHADDRVCVMSNDKTIPSAETLSWCSMYSENSCCSAAEDAELEREFQETWRSLAGHCPGCLQNTKAFQCAYSCDPYQNQYVTTQRASSGNNSRVTHASIRMCSSFCSAYQSSCGNTTTAEQEENNPNAFCPIMIDSAKASIGIYTYDCFNDPGAPNRCDGTRNGELEKPDTNWFFIACCIVLGLICVSLIVSVLCYTKKPARPAFYTDEGAGADSTGAGAPLVGNGVGRTAADHDGDSDAEANFL